MKNLQLNIDIFSAALFLFFIQQLTFLVESIYMLNLLNTEMDIRALGISFLFLPGLLLALKQKKSTYQRLILLMAICMSLSPMLSSAWRIFSSGIGAGLYLTYLGLQLYDRNFPKVNWAQSVALATLTSILFRIAGDTLDISITASTKWISWALIIITAYLALRFLMRYPYEITFDHDEKGEKSHSLFGPWASILGVAASFIFLYFVFTSPAVLARWTETNNYLNHIFLVVSIGLVVFFGWRRVIWLQKRKPLLIFWNILFLAVFIWNVLLHRVSFPTLEHISPKGVEENGAIQFEIKAAVDLIDTVFVRAGYSANADIVLDRRDSVLAISEALLQFESDSAFVEVETGEQEFEKRYVETGLSDGINIEILAGISKEDKIKKLN